MLLVHQHTELEDSRVNQTTEFGIFCNYLEDKYLFNDQ